MFKNRISNFYHNSKYTKQTQQQKTYINIYSSSPKQYLWSDIHNLYHKYDSRKSTWLRYETSQYIEINFPNDLNIRVMFVFSDNRIFNLYNILGFVLVLTDTEFLNDTGGMCLIRIRDYHKNNMREITTVIDEKIEFEMKPFYEKYYYISSYYQENLLQILKKNTPLLQDIQNIILQY